MECLTWSSSLSAANSTKGGGHQRLEYISRTDCSVGNKTKVNVTDGGMAAHRRKEKAVRHEHFSHAYPAPSRLPFVRIPPSQQIRTSIASWPKDVLYIYRFNSCFFR